MLLSVLFFSLLVSLGTGSKVLNFMLISSGGGEYDSSGVQPAVDLAVELVNENNVIPGYQLNISSHGNPNVSNNYGSWRAG